MTDPQFTLKGTKAVFEKTKRERKSHQERDRVESGVGPFAMIPKWVYVRVSEGAVILYIVLWYHANNNTRIAYPSKELLAEEMHCSVSTVDRRIKELVDAKAITIRQKPAAHGGWPHNIYRLKFENPYQ
jgi:hypothetical protein